MKRNSLYVCMLLVIDRLDDPGLLSSIQSVPTGTPVALVVCTYIHVHFSSLSRCLFSSSCPPRGLSCLLCLSLCCLRPVSVVLGTHSFSTNKRSSTHVCLCQVKRIIPKILPLSTVEGEVNRTPMNVTCLVSCHIQTQLLQQTIGGINECVEAQESCLRGKIARTSNACFIRGVFLITDGSCLQNEEYGNSSFPTRAFLIKSPPTSRPVSISGERIWSGFKSYEWENWPAPAPCFLFVRYWRVKNTTEKFITLLIAFSSLISSWDLNRWMKKTWATWIMRIRRFKIEARTVRLKTLRKRKLSVTIKKRKRTYFSCESDPVRWVITSGNAFKVRSVSTTGIFREYRWYPTRTSFVVDHMMYLECSVCSHSRRK
jgi:hypothetical protein